MQIQRINRTDDEKVYLAAKNVSGTTATTGFALRWVGAAAAEIVSTGGGAAVFATDAAMAQFAGVAVEDIAVNAYGRIQSYGLVSVAYSAEADKTVGVTGLANSFLKLGAVAGTFTSVKAAETLSTFAFRYVQAMTTVNISGGVPLGTAFVRAL